MKPYVTVSYAQSIDGRIATISGDSRWISGSATLKLAHKLRRNNDAILVGIGTVLRDDPLLTCRIGRCAPVLRAVLDSRLRIPVGSQIAETAHLHRTVVFTSQEMRTGEEKGAKAASLREKGVKIVPVPVENGLLDIAAVLEQLAAADVETLFVEGGGKVISAFLRGGFVDRMLVVTAPVFIGSGVSAVEDLGVTELSGAIRPYVRRMKRYGEEFVWDLGFKK